MLCPNSWPAHEIHAPSSALGIPLSQSSLLAELSGQLTSQHFIHWIFSDNDTIRCVCCTECSVTSAFGSTSIQSAVVSLIPHTRS
jgi:hypothetical protein